jgi:hypothetical protein
VPTLSIPATILSIESNAAILSAALSLSPAVGFETILSIFPFVTLTLILSSTEKPNVDFSAAVACLTSVKSFLAAAFCFSTDSIVAGNFSKPSPNEAKVELSPLPLPFNKGAAKVAAYIAFS